MQRRVPAVVTTACPSIALLLLLLLLCFPLLLLALLCLRYQTQEDLKPVTLAVRAYLAGKVGHGRKSISDHAHND